MKKVVIKNLAILVSYTDTSMTSFRRSHSQMFFKIGVLKNFVIFTEKHLYWSLLLIKLQA